MPGLWLEYECRREDLSNYFWDLTRRHRADFERLGFVECRFSKPRKPLDPMVRDCGGIFYLDPTRCYFGQLIYSQHYLPAKHKVFNHVVLAFTAVLESGSLSCTNNKLTFDSATGGEVIRMKSSDVTQVYNRFSEELQRREDKPRPFADVSAVRRWFDARQIKNFEDHVQRRLFIRMTEPEIAAVEAEMQRYGPGRGLPPRRRRLPFRLAIIPTFLLLVGIAFRIIDWRQDILDYMHRGTIEYQGQQFKTRLDYAEYDDYKDDPNNLDTNELGRIEETMEAVKVPASFEDRDAFIKFAVELEFPGYGLSDGVSQTDDGSTIEKASVEIPQRSKDRVIVVHYRPGERLNLIDDFIYEGSDTNDITRVQLEHRQLEYFDQNGRLIRKKAVEK